MEGTELKTLLDTVWVLFCAVLVFFMKAGFGFLEAGLNRAKNAVTILTKNFVVFGLAVIGFWSVGYGLMFGAGGLVGTEGFFLTKLAPTTDDGLPLLAFFFFQLCFAVTAATIVSGAVAERIKIRSYMIFAVLLSAVIYPVIGHWTWGGGWLDQAGFADFAGSTVVHSVGGWAALVGAFLLGPRLGRYGKDGRLQPIAGHNMAFVMLGGLILWLGWFGFNGGSQLAADGKEISHIFVTTALAAAFGTVAATLWAWIRAGKPDLTLIVNGMLGGLVGVTAGCAFVDVWSAAVIGAIAGVVVIESVMFFDRVRIDDPVGAVSVHLTCGVLGTLLTGVFGREALGMANEGLLFGGGATQLLIQLKGIAATAAFVVPTTAVVWLVLKKTIGIRVSEEEELVGLDVSEMGMEAYPVARDHVAPPVEAPTPEPTPVLAPTPNLSQE